MSEIRLNVCLTGSGEPGVEVTAPAEGMGPVYDARYQVATLAATRAGGRIVLAILAVQAATPDDEAPEECTAAAYRMARRLVQQVVEGWVE